MSPAEHTPGRTGTARRVDALRRTSRQLRAQWRTGGPRGLTAKLLQVASERLAPPRDDIGALADDLIVRRGPLVQRRRPGHGPLSIGWILEPPSAGSGGHTTMFRLVRGLEARGHSNVVHIRDRHCPGDVETSARVIAAHFPPMAAPVVDASTLDRDDGEHFDVLVATSWPTAYIARNARTDVPRAYLVQDFEPWFHPAGSAAALAEETYRFGFHGICAGRWLPGELASRYGMACDHFDLGVDTEVYRNRRRSDRRAVAFYARPCTPRRGFGLGMLALGLLAQRRPDIEIHLFGEDLRGMRHPFACTDHGTLTPAALDALFNECAAGLVLSFTNLSLLPQEMLASGCVPVVNDALHNRTMLDNPSVRYVAPTPDALADALAAAVDAPDRLARADRAAASVRGVDWHDAVDRVETALLGLTGREPASSTGAPFAGSPRTGPTPTVATPAGPTPAGPIPSEVP